MVSRVRFPRVSSVLYADMAELADAIDLGSIVPDVQVQVLLSAFLLFILIKKEVMYKIYLKHHFFFIKLG